MNRNEYHDEIKYSWDEVARDTQILSDAIKKVFIPDIVIVIATGGWIPARIMRNYINATYISLGCVSYDNQGNKLKEFNIYQDISDEIIKDKNVLILDEVCESGRTLELISKKIAAMQPLTMYTASLHCKDVARFNPDFIAKKFKDKWVIYPWDIV